MAKRAFFKIRKPFRTIATALEKEQLRIAELEKARLEEIVQPFQSDINFEINKGFQGGNLVVQIAPMHQNIPRRAGDPDSGFIDAFDLFFYLNDGTKIRHAVMPEGFQNETFPNSTQTRSVNSYRRSDIFVSRNIELPGLEPRNWLTLVNDEFEETRTQRLRRVIATAFRQIGGSS